MVNRLNLKKNDDKKEYVLTNSAPFVIREAYKAIRTNITYAVGANHSKVIIVTSSIPSEGKSTTSVNVAITMAQTESKVLLIDADLRKSMVHKLLRLNNSMGLSDVLIGLNTPEQVIKKDFFGNLSVMSAGTKPPNPAELLGSKAMTALIQKLSEEFDYIVIDTPPIGVVSDALVLMNEHTGVVVVCKQKTTTYEDLTSTVEKIKVVNTNILGTILTNVKENGKFYGKSYKYKYKYNYQYK